LNSNTLKAQGICITDGAVFTPDNSSVLELQSTSRGLILSRMTTEERDAIDVTGNTITVYILAQ
jgi:hypothetical protein